MDVALTVMAHGLVYWTQGTVARRPDGKGRQGLRDDEFGVVIGDPVLRSHSPPPRASLESHCRRLALELAPRHHANAIQRGCHGHARPAEDPRRGEYE